MRSTTGLIEEKKLLDMSRIKWQNLRKFFNKGTRHEQIPAHVRRGRQLVDVRALRADPVNGGDIFVLEYEGGDFTNRVMAVAGLAAGAQVSLSLSSPDGHTVANLVATADADGFAEFDVPVAKGANYTYSIVKNGATLCSGTIHAGRWDANGSWFHAVPDGHGGSSESGGAWTTPPVETNATTFFTGATSEFALSADARSSGSNRYVRAEASINYALMRSVASLAELPRDNSLAAVAVVETNAAGATAWAACVGGVWTTMGGAAPPVPAER